MSSETAPQRGRRATTARIAGVALLVVSALAGVVAAAFIGRPPWGVPAAIVLALASVGVAAGLLLQRGSDTARTSLGEVPGWSARRSRRSSVILGAFLLAVSAVSVVGLLVLGSGDGVEPVRSWTLLGGFAAFGIMGAVLLAVGLAPVPRSVASSERPVAEPAVDDAGWVRLGPDRSRVELRSVQTAIFQYQLIQVPMLIVLLLPVLLELGPWAVTVAVSITAIVLAVAFTAIRHRRAPSWIAGDGSALRHGSRQVPASEIATAVLSYAPYVPDATERSLTLALGGPRRFRAAVPLRRRGRLVLGDAESALLLELVARSSIELPRDEHDATGRFSKSLYPDHLTKAEAETVIARPPGDGEPLPIGGW